MKSIKAAILKRFAKDKEDDGKGCYGEDYSETGGIAQDANTHGVAFVTDAMQLSVTKPIPSTGQGAQSPLEPVKAQALAKAKQGVASREPSTSEASRSRRADSQTYDSVTLAVSAHCPAGLRRSKWSIDDFELRKLMYNGNISMVYHAVDKRSGITVALKLYKRHKLTEIERHQVAREIKLHVNLAHDAIIAMYAAWKDKSYVYMALEWAPGGDVYSYLRSNLGRLSEDLAVPLILEPFLSGLAVIHTQGLIHRDIKPENILLNNSFQIKIADFGLSIDSKNELANTRLGTIDYLAPEILDCPVKQHPMDNKENPNIGYSNMVDCWSVGVLAYELLVGQPPFAAPTPQETLRLIRTKTVEYPGFMSAEAVDFIKKMLVRDPTKRWSIAQCLEHPWVVRYKRRPRQNPGGLQRRNSLPGGLLANNIKKSQEEAAASQPTTAAASKPYAQLLVHSKTTNGIMPSHAKAGADDHEEDELIQQPDLKPLSSVAGPTVDLAASILKQGTKGPGPSKLSVQTGGSAAAAAVESPKSRTQKFFSVQTNAPSHNAQAAPVQVSPGGLAAAAEAVAKMNFNNIQGGPVATGPTSPGSAGQSPGSASVGKGSRESDQVILPPIDAHRGPSSQSQQVGTSPTGKKPTGGKNPGF